jgi:hypothetical protein
MNHIGDNFVIDERPHGVMHQDNVVGLGFEAGNRIRHRLLPVLAALHHLHPGAELFFFQLRAEAGHLIFAQRHNNLADLPVAREDPQGMNQNRRAVDLKKLLGWSAFFPGRRHAGAKSGGR